MYQLAAVLLAAMWSTTPLPCLLQSPYKIQRHVTFCPYSALPPSPQHPVSNNQYCKWTLDALEWRFDSSFIAWDYWDIYSREGYVEICNIYDKCEDFLPSQVGQISLKVNMKCISKRKSVTMRHCRCPRRVVEPPAGAGVSWSTEHPPLHHCCQ